MFVANVKVIRVGIMKIWKVGADVVLFLYDTGMSKRIK